MTKVTSTEEVYRFVAEFILSHGYSPTLQEIADALGYKSKAGALWHVRKLLDRGWLVQEPGKYRTLRLGRGAGRNVEANHEAV